MTTTRCGPLSLRFVVAQSTLAIASFALFALGGCASQEFASFRKIP